MLPQPADLMMFYCGGVWFFDGKEEKVNVFKKKNQTGMNHKLICGISAS